MSSPDIFIIEAVSFRSSTKDFTSRDPRTRNLTTAKTTEANTIPAHHSSEFSIYHLYISDLIIKRSSFAVKNVPAVTNQFILESDSSALSRRSTKKCFSSV